MKFTRKQMSTFKKLHPEAVCPEIIQEAQRMYERGMCFTEVCRDVQRALTVRQQLPWITPKYNPSKYPVTPTPESEKDLLPTADEVLGDLASYAMAAKSAVDAHETNLRSVCKTAQRDAVTYFRTALFDLHIMIINANNWLITGDKALWIRAEEVREKLSLSQTRRKHMLDYQDIDHKPEYVALRNTIYKRVKAIMKSDSKSAFV